MRIAVLRNPILLAPFFLGAASVGTLLIYFYGWMGMRAAILALLLPAALALAGLALWARAKGQHELYHRIVAGAWAGGLATLLYDLVRVPVVWSGVPVFKAISYFGTVILSTPSPTLSSEMIGWTYHFSNGIGFGIMYAALFEKPRWWSAVAWGLFLELAMLLTPYAEVFGYKVTSKFLGITIGAHVVYGLALWLALRYRIGAGSFASPAPRAGGLIGALFLLPPLGVAGIAADFHFRHAKSIPSSPPGYIGPHLYTTWNVMEPDRVALLWLHRKYVDPQAQYHLLEPFSKSPYGTQLDTPEAAIRRSGNRSATEVLLEKLRKTDDPKLRLLGKTTQLYEISPWRLPMERDAYALGEKLRQATAAKHPAQSLRDGMVFLDGWYGE